MTDIVNKVVKMLVVDDDGVFRERLVRALGARGLVVLGCAHAREAVEVAERERPQRAVVDLRMPGESGLELIRQLAAIDASMQIVVLTGYGSIPTAVEAVRRGAMDYLTKPADADQILAAFERDPDAAAPELAVESRPSLAKAEWDHIQRILADCGGNISEAARRLGIHRRSLQRKLGKMSPEE